MKELHILLYTYIYVNGKKSAELQISVVSGVREIKGIDKIIDVETQEIVNINSLKLGHTYDIKLITSSQTYNYQDLNVNDEAGLLTITNDGKFKVVGVGTGKITIVSPNNGGTFETYYTTTFNDKELGKMIYASLDNVSDKITISDLERIEELKDTSGNTNFSWNSIKNTEDLKFLPNLTKLSINNATFETLHLNQKRLEKIEIYDSSIKEIIIDNLTLLNKLHIEVITSINKLKLIGLEDLEEFELVFLNSQECNIKELYIESCPEFYNLFLLSCNIERAIIKNSKDINEVIFGTVSEITLENLDRITHLSVKTNKLKKLYLLNLPYFTFNDDSINLEVTEIDELFIKDVARTGLPSQFLKYFPDQISSIKLEDLTFIKDYLLNNNYISSLDLNKNSTSIELYNLNNLSRINVSSPYLTSLNISYINGISYLYIDGNIQSGNLVNNFEETISSFNTYIILI